MLFYGKDWNTGENYKELMFLDPDCSISSTDKEERGRDQKSPS
jgi:hypothetical protein